MNMLNMYPLNLEARHSRLDVLIDEVFITFIIIFFLGLFVILYIINQHVPEFVELINSIV